MSKKKAEFVEAADRYHSRCLITGYVFQSFCITILISQMKRIEFGEVKGAYL